MGEQKTGTVFVRTKKDRNYTVIDNTFLRDDRLSAQAKGVFAYILYLPEDWCIYQNELVNHFSNGRDALRSAIKELEEFGYISKEHKKDEKTGRFTHWQYTVNEIPVSPKSDLPKTENPTLENPTLLNTDVIPNTNKTNSFPTKLETEPPKLSDFTNNRPEKKTVRIKKMTKTEENNLFLSSLSEEEYKLSERCADLMIEYLTPITTTYNPAVHKRTWQADFVKRARDKKVSLETVLMCVQYVHDDATGFEQPNNASPEKIFKKLDYLFGKALSKKRYPQKSDYQKKRDDAMKRGNMNTGNKDYSL